jgi:hypothetical protein
MTSPFFCVLISKSPNQSEGLALNPNATTTASASYIVSEPGIGIGTLLPF